MATKKKGASPKVIKATSSGLQDAIRDAAGAKLRAKNAGANKATALGEYAKKSGFSNPVLGLVLKLHDWDDIKRTDFIRELLMAHDMMGWGKQSDLFDDIGEQIAEATKRAQDAENARKGKPTSTPGLPIEELAKGIKPLDEPAKPRRRSKNALPETKAADAPSRTPESVH
ncbi:hypothetical protein [Methylobacterium brachythecii]|uniref:Uncharacterized protein n=1 Tax=Methylobacterium brachythecii TaxID=1176177 RepID=A0A7W6AKG9_9HYPH|nr:hypothetical protein [Methylobacterium brachythecii]MBB3905097.1 hypothetical protein [Methylobacterium brachythecii]GLS44395.1 hypothetical protein GCM10007884_23830 [Methylobacterium brachythecii]